MPRLIGSWLLLLGLAWGQEQAPPPLRLRPPFGGLNLNLVATNIADNEWTVFSNAFVNGNGEILKRGGLGTIPSGSEAVRINDGTKTSQGTVVQLYRYYHSGGLKRLLALVPFSVPGGIPTNENTAYKWLWLNDTTGRFAYTYTGAPDTFSQVDYKAGGATLRVDTANIHDSNFRVICPGCHFVLHSSSRSHLMIENSTSGNLFGAGGAIVWVLNDTTLEANLVTGGGVQPESVYTDRKFELHYTMNQGSSFEPYNPYYSEAMSYLDTLYFSRSRSDPIAWTGTETIRANLLDFGVADTIRDSNAVDLAKSWTVNDYTGSWYHSRTRSTDNSGYTYDSPWALIQSNTASRLTLTTTYLTDGVGGPPPDTKEYAIFSMPVDENIGGERSVVGTLTPTINFRIDTSFSPRAFLHILENPLTLVVTAGPGKGQVRLVSNLKGDTVNLSPALTQGVTTASKIMLVRSRFPRTKFSRNFKGRTLWIADSVYGNSFWWSQPGRPGFVKPNDFSVVNPIDGQKIQAVWLDDEAVYFSKESKIYGLLARTIEASGNDPSQWQIVLVNDVVGCDAPKSVVQRGDKTWFYDWPNGFYEFSSRGIKPISESIRPIIDSINPGKRERVWGVYYPSRFGDFVLWGIPLNGSSGPNRVLSYSPATNAWGTWDITNTDSLRLFSAVLQEGRGDLGELIFGLADSAYILKYNPAANQDTLDGAGSPARTKTFALVAESKRFESPLNELRFGAFTPLYNFSGAGDVNFDFYKNFSTSSLQTLTLNGSGWINRQKSLTDAIVGNQLAWRITTISAFGFRLGGMDIEIQPAGRRLAE